MSQSETLQNDQIFGRYQIVRVLGTGGMGEVYEAVHLGLKKRFAIKTLLPAIAQIPEARARFLREGEAASRMNHPNVVDISDVGTEDGVPYLVMEYLDGETLGDFIARTGPLEVPLAVDLILPAISAVAAGHGQGVIHRDLKPQNIFLARGAWGETIPKILDFGVSKLMGGENPALTGTMAILGTASYLAPEQARGARVVDAKSDQYAMGLIFFEMLTGRRAHEGDHPLEVLHKIASGVVLDARSLRPDLPPELDAILATMLANGPEDRHPSLRAVGRALLPFASDRARFMYSGVFDGEVEAPASVPFARAEVGRTLVLPPAGEGHKSGGVRSSGSGSKSGLGNSPKSGGSRPFADSPQSGGTRLLPASHPSATPDEDLQLSVNLRGGSATKFVIGGVVLAAGIAVVVVLLGHAPGATVPSATATVTSSSSSAKSSSDGTFAPTARPTEPAPVAPAPVAPAAVAAAPLEAAPASRRPASPEVVAGARAHRHDVGSVEPETKHQSHGASKPRVEGTKAATPQIRHGENAAPIID